MPALAWLVFVILKVAGLSLQSLRQQGRGVPVYEITAERFRSESEAQAVLKSLQELPPPARYKPGDPSDS